MRARGALVVALAVLAFACSSDEGGPVDTRTCGSLSDAVMPAEFVWEPSGTPPEATGGTFVEGTYYLAEETLYGADPACGESIIAIETRSPNARQALSLVPSSDTTGGIELVTTVNADPVRASASYEIVDTTLSFSDLCGNATPLPQGTPFTAAGDEVWFFPPHAACGPEALRFVRY
jgi:hypothetical protein